ncbi:hypothetical protein QAD02_000909 [Eretmocerus hayati]|uniref:Uncharacterized protein n=1 Tax=Eretmocerus hayati TaxID=131215 RepID=A0ACC2NEQ7_9HYME|nr:hypothetical protein QAD02_000909 [Eretmocerus hayati]
MKSIPTIRMPFSMWHRPMLPVTLLLGLILLLVPVSEVTGHHHNRDDTASDASHHEQHRHRHHHRHYDNHENHHKRCPSHHHQDDENTIQAARSGPNLENVDEYSKFWSRHEPETQNRHDRLGTMAHRHSGHHLKVKPLSKEGEEISEEVDVDDPRWQEVRKPWKKNQDEEVDRDELFAQQYSRKRQNKVAKVRSRHRQQVWRPNHQNDFEDNDRDDNEFQEDDLNNEQENYARKLNQQDESSFQKSRVSSKLSDWHQRTRIRKPETTTARIDNELIRDGLEDEEQEDEDDVWLDVEQEDEGEMDNDFYENDEPVLDTRPPLKTYDDIIRRLTEGRVTSTSTQSPKKFHRGFQAHLKWDSHENLRHNSGESNSPRVLKFIDGSLATAESRTQPGKRHDSTMQKKKVEELEQNSESSGVANTVSSVVF